VRRIVIDDRGPSRPPLVREYACAGCEGTGDGTSSTPPAGWTIAYLVTEDGRRRLHGYFCCKPCIGDWAASG
jgi:hypothetical protein